MSSRYQLAILLLHALIAILVVSAATVLLALHDPLSPAIMGLFGAIIGLAGGSAGSLALMGQTINGKSVVSTDAMGALTGQLKATTDYLAGARQTIDASTIAGGRRVADPPPVSATPPPL